MSTGRHKRHQLIPPGICIKCIERLYAFAEGSLNIRTSMAGIVSAELEILQIPWSVHNFANHQDFNTDAPPPWSIHARFIRKDIPWLDGYRLSAQRNCHQSPS